MTDKLKVLVTRAFTEKPNIKIEELAEKYDLHWWKESSAIPRSDLLEMAKGASGILCLLSEKIDEELLDAAGPKLKVVSTMSVGYEHMDLEALSKRNIVAGHTPGVLTDAVADLNLALLLALMRRIPEAHQIVTTSQAPNWTPNWMLGSQFTGKTVGIYGLGRIGIATAKRVWGFSPSKIVYNSRSPLDFNKHPANVFSLLQELVRVDFEALLKESDILFICTDLNSSTYQVFNKGAFLKMKPNALLVNTSRGGIIDTEALVNALHNNCIYGAALDVTDPEPLPMNHPLTQNFGNRVVFAPHLGSATQETRDAMGMLAIANLEAGLKQEPLPASIST